MLCAPLVSADVTYVATPAVRAPVPSVVVPSLKVTVPVGVPLPVTVAVKVTDWPSVDGFALEVTAVVVTRFTVCVSGADVLPAKEAAPPYTAVMLCGPLVSAGVTDVAAPRAGDPGPSL